MVYEVRIGAFRLYMITDYDIGQGPGIALRGVCTYLCMSVLIGLGLKGIHGYTSP